MFSPTSPVTGASQTGLTGPTYTLTPDVAPDINGKQYAVTALGGTQINVTTHSMASPFTVTYTRVKNVRTTPTPNPSTGVIGNSPMNISKFNVRKGVVPLAGQAAQTAYVRMEIGVPAGSDTADAVNLRAMLSCAIGVLSQQAAGIGDSVVTNLI